ncbi:(2Fe-2S) ferredoxin domain-containing protein [Fulvivirga lutea]|uniref:(2Fe-2S) ferredoxin domain-containing protein n=1 Tax=Fulvivirga lutea TaxID=2810512 RepID=A0A974WEE3_9BACT|nr:(2Fe-2S) ferredoxin domain-containing protein [Fulvivirga lutea]QSE96541.1 (2Fe-2S) ferredoxin domain-containing protein [Fulvivirga lutea]
MPKKKFVFVCTDDDCKKAGSKALCKMVKDKKGFRLIKTQCMDACKKAPNIIMNEALYSKVAKDNLAEMLNHSASAD